MKKVKGDLIALAQAGAFDVIVHGCNCFCTMGAGIARGIAKTFPEALAEDKRTGKGDRGKLGQISVAEIAQGDLRLTVVNAYTQFDWRGQGRKADYDAIRSSFSIIADRFAGKRIGFPMIGAGLAGGDWQVIEGIIEAELAGLDYTLVVFDS
ncbi:macro domain-containing protein [Sulfitobacter mediterraneus]|jgi:O-acetyl-ADP-ribose deacetylase (regulator of RNase III)|uniref:macro domain-containing protein n=1 Tax=Sulfitobacter mediterraneus TaxID=83219 RepID=UPI00193159C9|nr:macro domain-containing protein [Sulfitobacter mediterraneus]MBM1634283.1 macro domain-containing protein [Sulfitobacter mediterraneus]MBM1642100.1 macro domain-containing protein [Sulfitobacter mediterraneus]MBM1646149.1 macro domain-containing protein [Sulfitobacter mediterraneus]MBM1650195.1 macro domain-containing protein [Sulfitobacter mediterraneus]MBM1654217.1 macro domain-containing protein [Sulfitobacter mediterraneus]